MLVVVCSGTWLSDKVNVPGRVNTYTVRCYTNYHLLISIKTVQITTLTTGYKVYSYITELKEQSLYYRALPLTNNIKKMKLNLRITHYMYKYQ